MNQSDIKGHGIKLDWYNQNKKSNILGGSCHGFISAHRPKIVVKM